LQPSWPWKSSSVGLAACSMVPIAPSATTTLDESADRNEPDLCARFIKVFDALTDVSLS
jgi:hypothetical protein